MDGVIYHTNILLPGTKEFVRWLEKEKKQFLFLTNSSENHLVSYGKIIASRRGYR